MINLLIKKIYIYIFCDYWDTDFCIVRGQEIKVYRDTFKKDISFWIYVNIRYENFHYLVIVDNMKEECALLEKLRKLQRVVLILIHMLCALCALGFK